jgi:hypothetical protein
MASDSRSSSGSPFQRFEKVMRALVQVPKKEVEKQAETIRRKRKASQEKRKSG